MALRTEYDRNLAAHDLFPGSGAGRGRTRHLHMAPVQTPCSIADYGRHRLLLKRRSKLASKSSSIFPPNPALFLVNSSNGTAKPLIFHQRSLFAVQLIPYAGCRLFFFSKITLILSA